MAVFDSLFERYRNRNRGKTVPQDTGDGKAQQQRFGENALRKNPNLPVFDNAQNNIAQIIDGRSVVSRFQTPTKLSSPETYFGSLFAGITAMPVYTNKQERVRQYRAMAQYTDCDFCLTELADDFLHMDDQGNFVKLTIPNDKKEITEDRKRILHMQFERFLELFHFKDDGFQMVKRFLVEGEVAYENIINPKHPELGIIGIKYLPTEYYETILNTETGLPIGIVFDKETLQRDMKNLLSQSCFGARSIFNSMLTTQPNYSTYRENAIPLLYPQITYFSSGDTSNDGMIQFPLIEKCKQAYHQLALMQDAAIILRVTRAPERLLFNISTNGMPEKKARPMINELINKMKSKKVVQSANIDGNTDITQVYDPVSMLETYFFGKSTAGDGTTIESVGSTADYEQIADIEFFLRKLFKQFKVPFSRFKAPENSMERDDTISYEEYSMARAVIRVQRRFAMGLKRSFITHLKLMKLWKLYNLKESDFQIDFNAPILYDLYNQQKMITAKMEAYKAVSDNDEFSKIVAMKKILKMTDEEIDENFTMLIKEKQWTAVADYMSDLVSEEHYPLDIKSPIRLNGIDGEKGMEPTEGEGGNEGEHGGEESPGEGNGEPPEPPEPAEGGDESEENGGETEPSFGLGS